MLEAVRNRRPRTPDELAGWVHHFLGLSIPGRAVCKGHHAPLELFAHQVLERPSLALWHGPRGSGKSFLSAIDTHLASRFHSRHETRILGGSRAQSEQIYRAIAEAVVSGEGDYGSDREAIRKLHKTEADYVNGSRVSILAASLTSVRGPHVASLKLDEVDEMAPDIRESALGMAMEIRGIRSSVLMTSTWHRLGGPMASLIDRGRGGEFPVFTWCIFEVLERCPAERSGVNLERCPQCPLVTWCHQDRDGSPGWRPKAKRSRGHYAIDALIQKVKGLSARVFASDYLCLGPKADGVWFSQYDPAANVGESAEYDPALPVHIAVDSGVFTGAVFFQVVPASRANARGSQPFRVHVFADYLAEGRTAEACAMEIRALADELCGGARRIVSTDSAGGARNPVGPTVIAEYLRCGLHGEGGILSWPKYPGCVNDGLGLIENLVRSADGGARLILHPRCRGLDVALRSYARARRGGQWMDYPADPQHPHEDLVDALRGGLKLSLPEDQGAARTLPRARAGRVF
ncbi:hypothetical protein OJF2_72650 [Aquisphaera giovannonii]|uniref:Terminase-like family protein n=1 Tax=Aquisphaera giovannonii TaxID=406548 RepID=A0A5B9WEJ0_9BACT|nr:hypothetical protein OJF2_72650 [Aquisphaera giovannonii]